MDNIEYYDIAAPALPPKECSIERNGLTAEQRNQRELSPRRPPLPPKVNLNRSAGDLCGSTGPSNRLNGCSTRSSLDLNRNSANKPERPKLSLDLSGINGNLGNARCETNTCNPDGQRQLRNTAGHEQYACSRDSSRNPSSLEQVSDRKLPSSEIANRVTKFEMLAVTTNGHDRRDSPPQNLWFYKDGLRSPTSPPPTSAKLVLNAVKAEAGSREVQNKCTASLVISPKCNRRQIEVDSRNLMTQSLTSLPVNSPVDILMTSSVHPLLCPANGETPSKVPPPSFSSNLSLTPLHSESRLSGALSVPRAKPVPPPRTTPVQTPTGAPPLPPKLSSDTAPPPRPASKELRLDDILMMCAEYEKQIEEEQRVALSLSFTSTPISRDRRGSNYQFGSPSPSAGTLLVSPFFIDSVALSPSLADDLTTTPLSPVSRESLVADVPPLSPSATIQQSRIKTNGSLPRDGKRLPSPSRSLPPTSPHTSEADLFTWERGARVVSPPEAGSPGCYLTHPSASPRTRIKTIVGKGSRESSAETLRGEGSPAHTLRGESGGHHNPPSSPVGTLCTGAPTTKHSVNGPQNGNLVEYFNSINVSQAAVFCGISGNDSVTAFSLEDYQGGEEELFDCGGKSIEELYVEAKDILDLVPSSQLINRRMDQMNASLYSSASKMIIGTGMLGQNRNGSEESCLLNKLRLERDETILEVSRTAQELADLELHIEEANRSVDMESSLLGAELTTHLSSIEQLGDQAAALQRKDLEIRQTLEKWRDTAAKETAAARGKLSSLEAELEQLEAEQREGQGHMDTDKELELLEKIKLSHEILEAERRHFEDLEFHQMESEAGLEADREEVLRILEFTEDMIRQAETEVIEVEKQQQEITYSQEETHMADQREAVSFKLREQQEKLSQLEEKLSQLLAGNRRSNDSGTITWSDEETIINKQKESLSTKAPTVKSKAYKKSAGSGEESSTDSTSDLPQDSSSTTPSPTLRRFHKKTPSPPPIKRLTKRSSMQRASDRYTDHLDGLTSADESRPMSTDLSLSIDAGGVTDASSWVGEGVIMRQGGASSRATTRPLTRYLPVTSQEDFDLRAHIETAGHQIELCKHIVLNSCSCRGYLSKLGARLKVWTKRWFVFDRNKRTLVYYNDKSESKVKGGIYFHSISEVYVDHQNNRAASQRVTFCMKTQDRSYLLMAPTPESMRIWVDVLFTGAEGYREFQC